MYIAFNIGISHQTALQKSSYSIGSIINKPKEAMKRKLLEIIWKVNQTTEEEKDGIVNRKSLTLVYLSHSIYNVVGCLDNPLKLEWDI